MYGASGKMGRGGGSGGKRNIHAPPTGRPTPASRLSMGGGPRGRGGPPASSLQVEESFSLVRENPLNFGMAIKLTADLVEEIKRVEAQGGAARIKFGANASGNVSFWIQFVAFWLNFSKCVLIRYNYLALIFFQQVIQVGDKAIKFTWSREPGDLCDVYEERQSGDDGNGLLVESGGTWRKVNVERELDESTKNHVKRLSEEAERKMKSRKYVIFQNFHGVRISSAFAH
ncbi:hypothetical protein SASPL_141869 [Salvia splendens]|uniref:Uncharacterized protein n=1 Tax=Salvia splendens TaxID=180675 RepID=A0A8X8WI73_SALSN|nr:hypothetical protein SASPL_141869 [Salvia splendens]